MGEIGRAAMCREFGMEVLEQRRGIGDELNAIAWLELRYRRVGGGLPVFVRPAEPAHVLIN